MEQIPPHQKHNYFDDMQAFLYLLTQQLQYQDPLDPMDTSEYTNQLVEYAEVEQSIQTNSYLESIITQNINSMSAQSVSYIDKTIQALSDYVPLQDGYANLPTHSTAMLQTLPFLCATALATM